MGNYAVISDNGGNGTIIYHDIAGEVYSFPKKYLNRIPQGTKVIYHRCAEKKDGPNIPNRLSSCSHYFGYAEIGTVTQTDAGNYSAKIINYNPFEYGVNICRKNKSHYEGENKVLQEGVRHIEKEIYDEILQASHSAKSILPPPTGIKTTEQITEILTSNIFGNKTYKVVVGKSAYWIYNFVNQVYYQLYKPKTIDKSGDIKVLQSKANNYAIIHNSETIGIIDTVEEGVRFSEGTTVKPNAITIYM